MQYKYSIVFAACLSLCACSFFVDRDNIHYRDADEVAAMFASVESTAVETEGDAADDPAIWIHPKDASKSLIIGTNKKAGLAVYNLQGEQVQFLPKGLPNNVDIRQQINLSGKLTDIGAFSDRSDNTVGWFTIDESGIEFINSFPVQVEPYGFCLGQTNDTLFAFVTYKSGLIEKYELRKQENEFSMLLRDDFKFASQLEGCVFDDSTDRLFVGEEESGIWVFEDFQDGLTTPSKIDDVGSENGIVADIEGLTIYHGETPYLIASSQGNDSFAIYKANPPYDFVKRFRILSSERIDGAQETDGIDVTAEALPGFPQGLLVVQDGFNREGLQNFKFVNADFD